MGDSTEIFWSTSLRAAERKQKILKSTKCISQKVELSNFISNLLNYKWQIYTFVKLPTRLLYLVKWAVALLGQRIGNSCYWPDLLNCAGRVACQGSTGLTWEIYLTPCSRWESCHSGRVSGQSQLAQCFENMSRIWTMNFGEHILVKLGPPVCCCPFYTVSSWVL